MYPSVLPLPFQGLEWFHLEVSFGLGPTPSPPRLHTPLPPFFGSGGVGGGARGSFALAGKGFFLLWFLPRISYSIPLVFDNGFCPWRRRLWAAPPAPPFVPLFLGHVPAYREAAPGGWVAFPSSWGFGYCMGGGFCRCLCMGGGCSAARYYLYTCVCWLAFPPSPPPLLRGRRRRGGSCYVFILGHVRRRFSIAWPGSYLPWVSVGTWGG